MTVDRAGSAARVLKSRSPVAACAVVSSRACCASATRAVTASARAVLAMIRETRVEGRGRRTRPVYDQAIGLRSSRPPTPIVPCDGGPHVPSPQRRPSRSDHRRSLRTLGAGSARSLGTGLMSVGVTAVDLAFGRQPARTFEGGSQAGCRCWLSSSAFWTRRVVVEAQQRSTTIPRIGTAPPSGEYHRRP
jgi:hypothetical protein